MGPKHEGRGGRGNWDQDAFHREMEEKFKRSFLRGHGAVDFNGGGGVAVAGVLAGVGLALGGLWISLAYGQVLGHVIQTVAALTALALGGLVSLTAAFFGLVIPRHVEGKGSGHGLDDEGDED